MKKVILISGLFILTSSFKAFNRLDKLIVKEIKEIFQTETFKAEPIGIAEEIKIELPKDFVISNFKKIKNDDETLGFYYVGKAFGKVDYFDFIVIFDAELIVEKTKILIYREDHGGEIKSKRWLKQFKGKTIDNELVYSKNIIGISGATISVKSMTKAVNNVLKSVGILYKNKNI